jgi:hypothetical protein|tara:strand:+ start:325 stop:519 length:195 start_codon:yes stop_codon:yes gene_type:complete
LVVLGTDLLLPLVHFLVEEMVVLLLMIQVIPVQQTLAVVEVVQEPIQAVKALIQTVVKVVLVSL